MCKRYKEKSNFKGIEFFKLNLSIYKLEALNCTLPDKAKIMERELILNNSY